MRPARGTSLTGGLVLAVALILELLPGPGLRGAGAADHYNLEEGLPVQVVDAYPIAYGGREVLGRVQYDQTPAGKDLVILEPRLEYGFAPNAQAELSVPFRVGTGNKAGSGDIVLGALYNFNTESLSVPAFSLAARADFPSGRDSRGIDTTLKFIATKTLGTRSMQRLHLNLAWTHNAAPEAGERQDGYLAILGFSRPLTADTLAVVDFVREHEVRGKETSNFLELGLRRQLTPLAVITFGGGADVSEEASVFRGVIGFQYSL
jgi:hypothetical protein